MLGRQNADKINAYHVTQTKGSFIIVEIILSKRAIDRDADAERRKQCKSGKKFDIIATNSWKNAIEPRVQSE